jgi:[ribosomal protein S5]-alanine N-acetyltransferase
VVALLIPTEIETDRLALRRPSAGDAGVQWEMWTERDPRVPPHRRIGPGGRPTVEDIAASLQAEGQSPKTGLLTIVRKHEGDVIGYCGLIFDGRGTSDEPELAYELLRRAQGLGYATEAARAVLTWAAEAGYHQVWAGVRRWNGASLRVLHKLAFVDTGQDELDADYGDSAVMTRMLPVTVR